jgi:hypothetical protein
MQTFRQRPFTSGQFRSALSSDAVQKVAHDSMFLASNMPLHRFPSDVRGDEPINDGFVIKHAANALGLTRGRTATLLTFLTCWA